VLKLFKAFFKLLRGFCEYSELRDMHALQIGLVLLTFLARTGRARVLLQTLQHGEFQRIPTVASETTSNINNEEEGEVDGDYLEVDIRRHHGQPKSFIDSRIRQGVLSGHTLVVPFDTDHHPQSGNTSIPEPSRVVLPEAKRDRVAGQTMPATDPTYSRVPEHISAEQHAAAQQMIATSGVSLAHPNGDAALGTLARPSNRVQSPAHGTMRGLELMIGVMLGVLLSLLGVSLMGRWSRKPARTLLPPQAPLPNQGLSGGRLELAKFNYHGSWFLQFTWSLDGSAGSTEHNPVTILSDNQEVGRVLGRLMATPNGEMYLMSAGSTWAILKKPLPSRHPGQLWDFKVCRADGTPYVEVKQRSEFKCHVDDAVSQRRIMTVIGNFSWPVFLSGERGIHVWLMHGSAKPSMCAQCEARPEMESTSSQSRRFHVTTTPDTDASLVLAILLGLQDVHSAAGRSYSSGQSIQGFGIQGDAAASPSPGMAVGTGAASSAGPPGAGATSSSGNDGQGSGSSGQPLVSEEKPPDDEPPKVTQPAMAA